MSSGFRHQRAGIFGVQGSVFRVQGLGLPSDDTRLGERLSERVELRGQVAWCWLCGLGLRVQGAGYGGFGVGCWVWVSEVCLVKVYGVGFRMQYVGFKF